MMSNFEKAKLNANIEHVLYGLGLTDIKISDNEFRSDCPFETHNSKNPFSTNKSTGKWKCFACGKFGSNIINLVEKAKRITFPKAINFVNEYSNATSTSFQPTKKLTSLAQQISTSEERKYTPEPVIDCWEKASLVGDDDTYFKYKKLTPPSNAKFGKNPKGYASTLMPFQDIKGNFKGFVCLNVESRQKFNFIIDGSTRFMLLGQLQNEGYFYIGEGIATVQTIWESANKSMSAIAVGGWANMLPVLQEITTTYPNLKPIVLLDLDKKDKTKEIQSINAKAICITPKFQSDTTNLKDFNDLLSKEYQTMEFIKEQVANSIQASKNPIELTHKTDVKDKQLNEKLKLDRLNDDKSDCSPVLKTEQLQKETEEYKNTISVVPAQKTELEPTVYDEKIKSESHISKTFERTNLIEKIKEKMSYFKDNGKIRLAGISTNFDRFNEIIGGLQKTHLITLAGRSGIGKSWVAINFIYNTAKQGKKVVCYSLEMSLEQIQYRLLSLVLGISSDDIRNGNPIFNGKPVPLEKIEEAQKVLSLLSIYILDTSENQKFNDLEKSIKEEVSKGAEFIVIDNIQLIEVFKSENQTLAFTKISKELKNLAKNNEVPIMILAQLNKEAEFETPRKSQIMHSDAISHNSDIVLLISQTKDQKQRNEFDIIIDKNRDGREGTIKFKQKAWLMEELSEVEQKPKKDHKSAQIKESEIDYAQRLL